MTFSVPIRGTRHHLSTPGTDLRKGGSGDFEGQRPRSGWAEVGGALLLFREAPPACAPVGAAPWDGLGHG